MPSLSDPEYWRERAMQARAKAQQTKDPRTRKTLLGIADNYDQLAEQQENLLLKALAEDPPR